MDLAALAALILVSHYLESLQNCNCEEISRKEQIRWKNQKRTMLGQQETDFSFLKQEWTNPLRKW